MSKIHFGAKDGNAVFTAHDTIRAKVSSEPSQAAEDLNNKIDWLVDKIDSQDPTRSEMLRACPLVKIMDGDTVVTTFDNPIYEHFEGLDINAVGGQVDRQKSDDKPSKQTNSSTKKAASKKSTTSKQSKPSSGKTSKKDQARDIFKRMSGERRKDVIDAMVSELGFSKAHASTYYQAIKKEQ